MFKDYEKINLDSKRIGHFLNGVKLTVNLKNDIYRIYDSENNFIGLGEVKENRLKRDVIIQ